MEQHRIVWVITDQSCRTAEGIVVSQEAARPHRDTLKAMTTRRFLLHTHKSVFLVAYLEHLLFFFKFV